MSERKPGYYMIRYAHEQAAWEPAEWDGELWILLGSGGLFSPATIREIGPRIPAPDEPWQCVPDMPTPEMSQEGEENFGIPHDCDAKDCQSIYLAMIAAAPKPEDT